MLDFIAAHRFSLLVASRDCSALGLLDVAASLVADQELCSARASVVVEHALAVQNQYSASQPKFYFF